MAKRNRIGLYELGSRNVRLLTRSGTGGEFTTAGEAGLGEICVGLDYETWREVFITLLHEVIEYAYMDMGVRFRPDQDYSNAADGYWFFCNHPQFDEVVARAGMFLSQAVPDLVHTYKKRGKK